MNYILVDDYFGPWRNHPDVTDERLNNALVLLDKVNALLEEAFLDGIDLDINPATGSYVSGKTYGGFRPQDCPQGAPQSSHKQGMAVDIYDPHNTLDEWCFKHQDRLAHHNLYMESPTATPKWLHLTTRAPKSLKRVFMP